MAKKELGYRESINEIEAILAKIEGGETDIDDLSAEIKRAAKLLQGCKEKLFQTEQEVNQLIIDNWQLIIDNRPHCVRTSKSKIVNLKS